MDALSNMLESTFVLVAGLAVRFFILVLGLAILAAVLTPFVYTADGVYRSWLRSLGFERVAGLTWRSGTYYAPVHTWLRRRAQDLRVGFDDLAARVLRHLDDVRLPAEGATLKAGDALLSFTSRGRRFEVPSPVGGVVQRVNRRLLADPDTVVRDPYKAGWLVDMRPLDGAYETLPADGSARRWFEGEAARLATALDGTGIQAADGGEVVIPADLTLTTEQLDTLAREFLAARVAPTV